MDDVRIRILPGSSHSKEDRNIAYRAMHAEAANAFNADLNDVVLDATYAPEVHRRAVVELAKNVNAEIYLIECRVSADEAVKRWRERDSSHAGVDMNEERVRMLAATFNYYGGGLTLNTVNLSQQECLAKILGDLRLGHSLKTPSDWGNPADTYAGSQRSPSVSSEPEVKLSPWSRRQARNVLRLQIALIVLAILPALVAGALLVVATTRGGVFTFNGASAWLTAAAVVAGYLALADRIVIPRVLKALDVMRAGVDPRYSAVTEFHPSNQELYEMYRSRLDPTEQQRILLPGVPLFFIIPPSLGLRFDVRLSGIGSRWNVSEESLAAEAANQFGFDWWSYKRWRARSKSSAYYGSDRHWETRLRVTDLKFDNASSVATIQGCGASYQDYLVTEQSLDIQIPGELPYMRAFLEGDADWYGEKLSLADQGRSSTRFSCIASITVIVTTSDDPPFIMLQGKSGRVQVGGGVAASATGGIQWEDVKPSVLGSVLRAHRSIRRAVFRELTEEVGLRESDFLRDDFPFIGAAYNLRYGRDLNFYAHLTSELTREQIVERFYEPVGDWWKWAASERQDRWEVAHLIFLPAGWVRPDGELDPRLDKILGDSRHVRGALFAFGVVNG